MSLGQGQYGKRQLVSWPDTDLAWFPAEPHWALGHEFLGTEMWGWETGKLTLCPAQSKLFLSSQGAVLTKKKRKKNQLQVGMKIWPKVLKDKWKHAIFLYFINTASHIEWVPMTARDVSLSICSTQATQNIGIGRVGKFSTW